MRLARTAPGLRYGYPSLALFDCWTLALFVFSPLRWEIISCSMSEIPYVALHSFAQRIIARRPHISENVWRGLRLLRDSRPFGVRVTL